MIHRSAGRAALLAAVVLAACQSGTGYQRAAVQPRTPMDGKWASTDGVFIATFQGGSFTSRFTRTNEVLAQGTYSVNGSDVSLRWLSVQAQEQRAAECMFVSPDTVRCQQAGGGSFDLQRSA